jgi:hypothetical protein
MAVLGGSILLLGLGLGWTFWTAGPSAGDGASTRDRHADTWPSSPWKNARPDVQYVGDDACVRCHADIAETFRRHPMGRSLAPIDSAPSVGGGQSDGTTTVEAGSSRLTVERRGGREVHREARTDEKGRVLAQVEAVVKYALGSGTRGVTYLVERDGRLFESPISWYSQKGRYDLSPGYEHDNAHFNRAIEPNCLFCHANRVEPVGLTVNRYEEPLFRGHAIGCERCHGPGELHVRRPEVVEGRDPTIVNPRHLEPALRVAVCEQCHLLGTHRIERPGRGPFDYRPGFPTIDFFAIYGRADERGNKVVGHVEQMKASRCFRESRGELGCTSCHDPHQVPSTGERTEYFRGRCLACHESKGCKLPRPERLARSPDDDCTRCHMPRSQSLDIAHVATTDHRISRVPEAPTTEPDRAAAALPLVLMNGDGLGRKEVDSLGRELAIALTSEWPRLPDTPQVRRMGSFVMPRLDQALADRPDDLVVRRMKAMAMALMGRRTEAIREVESVLRTAPSYEKALDECLSYAIDAGDIATARSHARQAVAADPASSVFHERLAFVSVQDGDWGTALDESRAALEIDPFLRFARMFLVQALLHRKDRGRADQEFAILIGLNPGLRESLERWYAEQRRAAAE